MKKIASASVITLLLISTLSLSSSIKPVRTESRTLAGVASLPPIDWVHYHNYTEMVTMLLALNETYPDIVDVFSIGKSWQNRDIYCVRLTNENDPTPKPKVFFMAYQHAREAIGFELAFYFVIYAATNYGTNATITELINKSEIYVVTAVNVDGFNAYKANDWQRKNAHPIDEDGDGRLDEDPPEDENGDGLIETLWNDTNGMFIRWEGIDNDGDGKSGEDWVGGVDLNRNYDFGWAGGSTNPRAEDYGGTAPFSEPETQAIRDFVYQHDFTYAIDIHSGASLILYPWGTTYDPAPDEAKFIEIASDLSSLTGGTPYEQSSQLYITHGAADDWFYGAEGILSLTLEIFTNDTWPGIFEPGPYPNTHWEDGVKYWFNPFSSGIESTVQRWLPAFIYITNRAISENSQPSHNVAIDQIESDKTVVGQGYSADLNIMVRNKGTFPETFNVTVYANTITLTKFADVTLAGGAAITLTFAWNTTGFARGNYTISANATIVLGETYTADNNFTYGTVKVTIPGDVDGDFFVNIQDATQIGFYWLQTIPPAPANVDINDDGIINILDATIVGYNWLQHAKTQK